MDDRRRGHIERVEHGTRDTVIKDPESKSKISLESLSIPTSHLDKKSGMSRHDRITAMFESKSVAHKKILRNLLARNHAIGSGGRKTRNIRKDQQCKPNDWSDRKSNDRRGFGDGKENPRRDPGAVQTKDIQSSEYNMAAKDHQQRKFPTSSPADVSNSNEYSFMADKSPTFTMTSSNNIAIARTGCTLRRARLDICGDDAAVGAILNTKVTTKRSGQAALDVVNYDSNGSAMGRSLQGAVPPYRPGEDNRSAMDERYDIGQSGVKSPDRRGQNDRRGRYDRKYGQHAQDNRSGNGKGMDDLRGGPDGHYAGYNRQSKKPKTNKSSRKPTRNLHGSDSETDLDHISESEYAYVTIASGHDDVTSSVGDEPPPTFIHID